MSTKILDNLKYTNDHEWALIEGDVATIGVTDFAQSSLGDVVFVELPSEGSSVSRGTACGVVESIKSVSDLFSPVSGEVIASNHDVEGKPELLNQNPYENWLIKVKISNKSELQALMSAGDYKTHCENAH